MALNGGMYERALHGFACFIVTNYQHYNNIYIYAFVILHTHRLSTQNIIGNVFEIKLGNSIIRLLQLIFYFFIYKWFTDYVNTSKRLIVAAILN